MKEKLKANRILYLKAVIMGLLPLLCCAITCAIHGYGIGDIYLPASDWNDELFYYKQVESMLEYGYPQGYFGFNESIEFYCNKALEIKTHKKTYINETFSWDHTVYDLLSLSYFYQLI